MGIYTVIGKKYKSIARYNQILSVLVRYGFEDLVQHLEEKKRLTFLKKLIPKKSISRAMQFTKWEKIRLVCEELGPTFVKFGQILSNRPDLIPMDLTFELEKLQDTVPPMSEYDARTTVESELGDSVENLFAWFEPKCFASASMSQVHKVTLHSGKRVALKIQRPDIKAIITEDIKVMYGIAEILENRMPSIRSFDPVGLVKNFEEAIMKELDFINESINIQRFYNNIINDPDRNQFAYCPKVYQEFTTSKVLAMELISGIKIDQIKKLKAKEIDTKVIAHRLSTSFFKQIFEYGFFHADPHPGNLLVLDNRHICYLDFGMMGSILPRDVHTFSQLFLAVTQKNVGKIILSIQELSNNTVIDNMRQLEFDINEFVEKTYVRSVHKNEMSTILIELKDIIINHGLKVPTHFYLFARSLVTLEGVIQKLNPELNQFEIAQPFLVKNLSRNFNLIKIGEKMMNSIYEMSNYMEYFPRDLKNAVRKINSGRIKVDLTHKGIDHMVHTMQRITKQLIAAFIVASLIIGGTLFILFETTPLWRGVSVLGIIGFVLAFIVGFGMIRDILKKDYDKW